MQHGHGWVLNTGRAPVDRDLDGHKVTVTIETGNAAFADHPEGEGGELGDVLRRMADRFDGGPLEVGTLDVLYDANGNEVGRAEVVDR